MKQTTQEILNLIDGDVLKRRNEFNAISETIGIASSQIGDELFSDIITSVNWSIDLLKEAIDKGILDALSSATRANLKTYITSLQSASNDLFINKTITDFTTFVAAATNILNFVDQSSLDLYIKYVPDYKKKLEEIKQLRTKLQKLNSDTEAAKKLLTQSEELLKNIAEKYSQNDKAQTDFNTNVENAKKLYSALEESKKGIQERITEIESFYNEKFKLLNDAILKSDTGLEAILNFATQKYAEIKDFSTKANGSFIALSNSVTEYEKILKNLTATNNSIQELFVKVNDPEQGIEKKFNAFTSTKAKIDELYTKSTESFKIISDLEVKIDTIFKEATEKLKAISEAKEESEKTFKEIAGIYGIAADTAMGGEFDRRSRELKNDFNEWSLRIIITTTGLFIAIVFLFLMPFLFCKIDFCQVSLTPAFLLRLTITSPLIFYLIFCTTQYNRAKDSYYKYAFKSTLAFSIKNHINLLVDNPSFKNGIYTEKILDFAIRGLDKIYDEPYFDESMKHKFQIREDEIKFGSYKEDKSTTTPPPSTPSK